LCVAGSPGTERVTMIPTYSVQITGARGTVVRPVGSDRAAAERAVARVNAAGHATATVIRNK
jgi:hypothetical protein